MHRLKVQVFTRIRRTLENIISARCIGQAQMLVQEQHPDASIGGIALAVKNVPYESVVWMALAILSSVFRFRLPFGRPRPLLGLAGSEGLVFLVPVPAKRATAPFGLKNGRNIVKNAPHWINVAMRASEARTTNPTC